MPNSHKLRKDSKNVNFKIGPLGPKKLSQIFNMPIIKSVPRKGQKPLNLTSEGQKYPPEVRVRHETCSTICGTPVQAILDQKNLTGLAGGVREGQNNAFVHISH